MTDKTLRHDKPAPLYDPVDHARRRLARINNTLVLDTLARSDEENAVERAYYEGYTLMRKRALKLVAAELKHIEMDLPISVRLDPDTLEPLVEHELIGDPK